jgi:hypothetical protein
MANLSKLKRRNTLGDPPPFEEASQNLQAPEIALVVTAPAVLPRVEAVSARQPVREQQDDTQPPRDGSVAKFDFWAKSKNLVSGIQ